MFPVLPSSLNVPSSVWADAVTAAVAASVPARIIDNNLFVFIKITSFLIFYFDKAEAAAALVNALLEAKGLEPGAASVDWQAYAQQQYDKLAAGLRASLDMKRIYRILNGEE